jgi:lysophospholipid acyltransferase
MLRPFFVETDGKTPTPHKRYYDIFTWFITQTAFAFAVSCFIILDFKACIIVWARVYFYALFGLAVCYGFLQSPGRAWLQKQVKQRTAEAEAAKPGIERAKSAERLPMLGLGMPDDPEAEVDAIVKEVKAEIERRRAQGMRVPDVKQLIRQKLEEGREGLTGEMERRTRSASLQVNAAAEKVGLVAGKKEL